MKIFATIIFTILIAMPLSYEGNSASTICRSRDYEIKFKELAGPDIQVLAVCPKKGIYFVGIKAKENDISQFKKISGRVI